MQRETPTTKDITQMKDALLDLVRVHLISGCDPLPPLLVIMRQAETFGQTGKEFDLVDIRNFNDGISVPPPEMFAIILREVFKNPQVHLLGLMTQAIGPDGDPSLALAFFGHQLGGSQLYSLDTSTTPPTVHPRGDIEYPPGHWPADHVLH